MSIHETDCLRLLLTSNFEPLPVSILQGIECMKDSVSAKVDYINEKLQLLDFKCIVITRKGVKMLLLTDTQQNLSHQQPDPNSTETPVQQASDSFQINPNYYLTAYKVVRAFMVYFRHEVDTTQLLKVLSENSNPFGVSSHEELKQYWADALVYFTDRKMLGTKKRGQIETISDAMAEGFMRTQDVIFYLQKHIPDLQINTEDLEAKRVQLEMEYAKEK
ncbi:Hypothetical_protein [Hexamita inflata]|uniref:Hypothetical_protein n=1 Tax=Hexamita inflata TaxID=28002 RepID=A0AA86R507_9EUKA|nr:Hypothetical protein HINF_LOCUS50035 [Hexamita inflata]